MRKKLAGILAVLMILCMSTTVFAANSPTSEEVIFENITSSATVTPGQQNVNINKVDKVTYEEAKKETSGSIVSMAEIKLNNIANTDLTKGVSVTVSVSTLTSDDSINTIRIMHKRSSDGKWEIIKPSAVDPINKTVTLTLYEFSPIAIVRYEAGKAPEETQNKPAGSTPQVNPVYDQVSTTIKTLEGEKIIRVTKVDQVVYEEAVKETTGAVVSMANLSTNNIADADPSKGVVVSLYVATLTADDSVNTIRLLHKRSTDQKWEVIVPTSVNPATKVVTATFYGFSPVAVVRYAVGNAPASTQYIPQSATITPVDPTDEPEDPADEPEDPDYGDDGDDYDYGDDVAPNPHKDQNDKGTTDNKKPAASTTTKPAVKTTAVHVSSVGSAKTSPKTGASMPVLPAIAMFSLMGIAYCGKKAKSL